MQSVDGSEHPGWFRAPCSQGSWVAAAHPSAACVSAWLAVFKQCNCMMACPLSLQLCHACNISSATTIQGCMASAGNGDIEKQVWPWGPQVAAYEFTTLTCVPGVVRYRGAKIQLLDLPGIIEGAKDGKGRGRQVHLDFYQRKVLQVQLMLC